MKKLVFLFAMVLFAGFAMAQQNKSEIIQASADNAVTVNQVAETDEPLNGTYSWVNQQGSSNTAAVDQQHTGDLNSRTGNLDAYIDQLGNDNDATQLQGPHSQQGATYAKIWQGGNENTAFQNQVKYGNSAEIYQGGNGNTARQAQDIDLPLDGEGSFNMAYINQSGDDNSADQHQDGWANEATVYQEGSGNTATQNQVAWVSDAYISQSGNDNTATQDQSGKLNSASIDQSASESGATQTQVSSGARASAVYDALNDAEIIQMTGTGNTATQMQTMPSGVATDILPNYAFASQDGSSITATQTQTGGNNWSSAVQAGSGHTATVTQSQTLIP
ncbi:hypothetical protein [uncultured Draconibacterium sp.]|uniref:hypothetical protein n=1 Tax=uncultured Draconibacterium sp. TaxID=1573823 RepID=UPI0029C8F09A|nr:hypothetical protein [uncultured Draconibacterium sp.]